MILLLLSIQGLLPSTTPPIPETYEAIKRQCLFHAANPKNPWAMAHGITAFGPLFVAEDGRLAADVIVEDFLLRKNTPFEGAMGFARFAPDGTPIEPHTNLVAKTFVLANLPMSRSFKTAQGAIRLRDLVASVKKGFAHSPQIDGYWQESAWTLDLLAATLKPGKSAHFTNALGQTIDFNQVMEDALSYLERAHSDLAKGLEQKLPQVDKRKQGIYAHACGGMHLIQAVYSWARHSSVRARWAIRIKKQTEILFYRLQSESRQYDAALKQAPAEFRLKLVTQKLKFYGHFLETLGRMKDETGFRPTPSQQQALFTARALLDMTIRELEEMRAFQSMKKLETQDRQTHLDLIGDACHAVNGLNLWKD